MVREQAPAHNPPLPTQANALPLPLPHSNTMNPKPSSQNPPGKPSTANPPMPSFPQPEFGRPSALGASPQPFSRQQPLTRPDANTGVSRQSSASQQDSYSHMFSKRDKVPNLHRPTVGANPLGGLRDINVNAQPKKPTPAAASHDDDDDDFFVIQKPQNFPSWQPKPVTHQTFSSNTNTNPFVKPRDLIDLTVPSRSSTQLSRADFFKPTTKMTTSSFFTEDRSLETDPFTYIDSAKANEDLKALLEGAFEDEEDKPRTRRRKKESEAKIENLADKVKKMNVKPEGKHETRDEQVKDANDKEAEKEEEEDDDGDDDDGTVEGLKVKLLPHQIEGVAWMRDKELGTKKTRGVYPKGGILADDMGLGKTIQSIALILTNRKPSAAELATSKRKLPQGVGKGTLVVAPLALIKQWEGEIKDRIDTDHALNVCVHHGPKRTKSFKELAKYDVVITTYQTLSSEHAESLGDLKSGCFGVHWYRVILDEAHSIKNRNAKATKAACALNSEYRWCLTGTPMQNNLDELQSLIKFLQIKPYDDLNTWRESITKPMNNGRGGLAIRRLQVYLKAFMKRRTKDILKQEGPLKEGDSGKEGKSNSAGFKIVQRTVEKVDAEFSQQEREFYDRLESRTDKSLQMMMAGNQMSYASALVLLMRLRQACNHPKLTGSDLSNEKDALAGSETGSRKTTVADDMDDIANMLGGLSVQTKRCDVCQIELSIKESKEGAIRCAECEEDLEKQQKATKTRKSKKSKSNKTADKPPVARTKRRVVLDSDDEDEQDDDDDDDDDEQGVDGADSSSEDEYTSDEGSSAPSTPMQSAKIRHLLQILQTDSHTHKYIVFSFFTSMLDLIEPFLASKRIRYVRYDGKMRNDAREASLASLRTDPSTRVLLCSLRAGSLGLNLTAASRVVILEPFWNPFVEEQAIDRVHRLNQTQDVKVFKLTVRDTVEERILALQEKKRELANATIEGRKGAVKLTLQDMLRLFSRDAEAEHPVNVGQLGRGGAGLLDKGGNAASQGVGLAHATQVPREKSRYSDPSKVRKEHELYGRKW